VVCVQILSGYNFFILDFDFISVGIFMSVVVYAAYTKMASWRVQVATQKALHIAFSKRAVRHNLIYVIYTHHPWV